MEQKESKNKGMTYFLIILSFLCIGAFIFKIINSPEKVNLTSYEEKLLSYFKEVALNSEFGKSPRRVVRWNSKMILYISKDKEYLSQVRKIHEVVQNINSIVSESNFRIEITNNKSKSNSIIFLGDKKSMEKEYPSFFEGVNMDLIGLVDIEFDNNNLSITSSKIFIDTEQSLNVQLSTILEELTQSIGLPADSKTYPNSIFYEDQIIDGKMNTDYSILDIDIIKLLYHPLMKSGLNTFQVTNVFRRILKIESIEYFKGNISAAISTTILK